MCLLREVEEEQGRGCRSRPPSPRPPVPGVAIKTEALRIDFYLPFLQPLATSQAGFPFGREKSLGISWLLGRASFEILDGHGMAA